MNKNGISKIITDQRTVIFALLALTAPNLALSAVSGDWEEITPAAVSDAYPTGCAYDDVTAALYRGAVPVTPYKYMIQKGTSDNLLILLDQGGSCWDPNTCGLNPPVTPTFYPFITEYVDPTDHRLKDTGGRSLETGILNESNDNNPFKGYTKVFVPYCTGDIFWGNKDKVYSSAYGSVTIYHRGYANLIAVLQSIWAMQGYGGNVYPGKVVIAGTSGGAYGAIAAFTEVEKRLPKWQYVNNQRTTLTYLIADSANGIVTDSFLNTAVNARTPDNSWGVRESETLPDYLRAAIRQGAVGLPVRIYGELAWRYPKSRFAQYQNAYDAVQGMFYNIMKDVSNPLIWTDSQYLLSSVAQWAILMRIMVSLEATASNYRFYTAAGTEHTVLIDIPPEAGAGFCSDDFDTEASAANIPLTEWVRDMLNVSGLWSTGMWRNATCLPNCVVTPKTGCTTTGS